MYRSLAVKSLVIIGLIVPFAAFGQTPVGTYNTGGYIAPIGIPGPPILTPPNVALPGSGPATGMPPSVGVNDSRTGGAGAVYQPGGGSLIGSELPGTPAPVAATGNASAENAANGAPAMNSGMGTFVEGTPATSETSLADIARDLKAKRANAHPRSFDNNSVRHADYGTPEANAAALPQGDLTSATYGSTSTPAPDGVLNQRDYAAVQAALARSQAQVNANAADNTVATAMPDPNRTYESQSAVQTAPAASQQNANEAATPAPQPQANTQSAARTGKQLPASASPLPLFAVLGLIALTVGGFFTYRMRIAEVRS